MEFELRLPGGEEAGEERDQGVRERGEHLSRAGEHTTQEAGCECGRRAGVAVLAGGLGGGEKDGEDVAVERGGGGRGVVVGRFVAALLPPFPLPAPIHGVRFGSRRRLGAWDWEAACARWGLGRRLMEKYVTPVSLAYESILRFLISFAPLHDDAKSPRRRLGTWNALGRPET